MQVQKTIRGVLSLLSGSLILVSMMPGQALADAQVRFLHAVPGGPSARLQVSGKQRVALDAVGFGEATQHSRAPARKVELALVAGGKRIAKASSTFEDGARYTVVARSGRRPTLLVLRDRRAAPGRSLLRVVHAAPELGTAEMRLDGRSLDEVKKAEASRYFDREPGSYRLTAVRPGSDDMLLMKPDLSLVAGTSATAYLVGSAGERTRFVVLEDAASGPASGPATGLGGLAGGDRPWLLALLAALLTGASCGLLYSHASRRRGRAGP